MVLKLLCVWMQTAAIFKELQCSRHAKHAIWVVKCKWYVCKNNIQKYLLDTVSDSNRKVERKGTKPLITRGIINKIDE
jgi:hypothetical protein